MRNNKGFSLIEIMIVLGILGAVIAVVAPKLSNRNNKTRAFLRQMTVLSRELHTRAKLNGTVYRLVLDLKDNNSDPNNPKVQTYWVEKSNGKAVLKADEEQNALKLAQEKSEEAGKDKRGFEMDASISKEPKEMPPGLFFDRVELSRIEKPITNGKAFIHYMPEGLVDEAAIHLKGDRNQAWTISIHPLTGKAELISKSVGLKELKQQ